MHTKVGNTLISLFSSLYINGILGYAVPQGTVPQRCLVSDISSALQSSGGSTMCAALGPPSPSIVTAFSTTTLVVAASTYTISITTQPTLTFTVFQDYLTLITVTLPCTATPYPTAAAVSPVGRTGRRERVEEEPAFLGISIARLSPRVIAPTAAPVASRVMYPNGGELGSSVPSAVSSAYSCLATLSTTTTVHMIKTVTSNAPVMTSIIGTVNPIIEYVTSKDTRTGLVTHCLGAIQTTATLGARGRI
ncbi:hypothetical protein MMC25_003268 [Agyrium rufum]|nr:hypothetical protein [Agyrium rufum]